MKDIKTLSKRIGERRAETERLKGQSARGETAIAAATQQDEIVAEIRRRLAEESAQAFVDNRAAKTAPIDAELATAVQAAAQMQVAAEGARSGLEIIQQRCNKIEAEIEDLIAKRRNLVAAELAARREAAIDEYVEAVEALAPIFSKMISADRLTRVICGADVPRLLPGEALLARVRLERLPIPWERSGKERPIPRGAHGWAAGTFEAAEPFMKFEPVLSAPAWLHDDSLIYEVMESLAVELRAAGVDGI
ncbi:hypothetical protein PQR65_05260 [Paraburkholderia nemoris]|uniref:hypothetical protein n=1 Tax=Paraburkholderia nemoris TaxID=2793076 RepID=UPI0038BADB57